MHRGRVHGKLRRCRQGASGEAAQGDRVSRRKENRLFVREISDGVGSRLCLWYTQRIACWIHRNALFCPLDATQRNATQRDAYSWTHCNASHGLIDLSSRRTALPVGRAAPPAGTATCPRINLSNKAPAARLLAHRNVK